MFKTFCLRGESKGGVKREHSTYLSLNQSETEDFPVAKEKKK